MFAQVLIKALDADILSKEQVVFFVEKYQAGDEMMDAAWQIFEMESDLKELVDTLFRIYRAHLNQQAASIAAAGADTCDEKDETDIVKESSTEPTEESPSFAVEGLDKELVGILNQCLMLLEKREEMRRTSGDRSERLPLPPNGLAEVRAMAREKHPLLIAVLRDFSQKKNIDTMLDHLYVIAMEIGTKGRGAFDKEVLEEESDEEGVDVEGIM